MSTQVKLRRGTSLEHETFTGASAELTVDTTEQELVLHDGLTPGGHPLAKKSNTVDRYEVGLKCDTLDDALNNMRIKNGDSLSIKERVFNKGGGATWDVVVTSSVIPNGVDIVQSVVTPSLSLVLRIEGQITSSQAGMMTDGVTDVTDIFKRLVDIKDGLKIILEGGDYSFTDTVIVTRPVSVVGVGSDLSGRRFPKIIRSGNVDLWRSCFHVQTSNTNFDKLYLYAEDSFSERGGITYGTSAKQGNTIGTVQGAYWRLGVVYPKDTTKDFGLNIDKITSFYSGRTLATSTQNTPYGAINVNATEGIYSGFVDISGGSVWIGSISVRNGWTQAIKKGNEGLGGKIKVGSIHASNGLIEVRLEPASSHKFVEDVEEGTNFTGLTSGATGEYLGGSRERIDLVNVSGVFQSGEVVSDGTNSLVVETVTDFSSTGMNDGVVGNGGTHFDSFEIDSVNIKNYPGDILWILNNGTVSIGSIVAENIKNCRHMIRYTPFKNGIDTTRRTHLQVGSCTIDGAAMITSPSYYPLFFAGDADVTFGNLKAVNVTANTGSNFISSSVNLTVNSLHIQTTGGSWPRFLALSTPRFSLLSNCILEFDNATKLGTVNDGTCIITSGRHTNSGSFDGTGTVILNEFSAL